MGFPDDYTLIPYRGKPAADGPRYKALGNSMAVPCMHWIGKRIAQVEAVTGNPSTSRVAV
jgi:DNA (cytosine-5)-methyltransferase 1